jgi:hypothetical protein
MSVHQQNITGIRTIVVCDMKVYIMLGGCWCDTIVLNVHNVPHTGTCMNTFGLFFIGRHYQTNQIMTQRQLYSSIQNVTILLCRPIFN